MPGRLAKPARGRVQNLRHEVESLLVYQGAAGALIGGAVHENVMINGKGRVRITDFGLAGFADQIKGSEVMAGAFAD